MEGRESQEGAMMVATNNFWKTLVWVISIPTILTACIVSPAATQPTPSPTQVYPKKIDAYITVKDNHGKEIPSDFVSLSIEMRQVCEILQLDAQNPSSYEQLYKNLGSTTLHIEGNTADLNEWSPTGQISCNPNHPVVTKALVNSIFAFARRIQWKVMWGLNLTSNNPTSAANEAAYVAAVGGSTLIGFTIGNEPELYVEQGLRPSWWGYQNYRDEWEQYRSSILQKVQTASFIGPEACCETPLYSNFLGDEVPKGLIVASHHFYTTTTTATGEDTPSIPFLLSQRTLHNEITLLNEWEGSANTHGVPLALTEVNSVSEGGEVGVSDTLAAALWATDFLFQAAQCGISGVGFHSAPQASYSAINDNGNVAPLYYGLLLFHYVTQQARFLEADIQTKINITAYALARTDSTISVIVINKDVNNNATVEINTGSYSRGTAIRLTAPSIASNTGVTLGQRPISQKGTWAPNPIAIPMRGNIGYVEMPAGSATIVTLSRS